VAVLEADRPDVTVRDQGTFYVVEGAGAIEVDLRRVAEELGSAVPMSRWLLALSSFVGRVICEEPMFVLTAEPVSHEA
jgi:hypothetical protein